MLHALLADLIVAFHFLFVVFVLFGALLLFYRRWVVWLHLPAAVWGASVELAGWICPLTPWEVELRRRAGQSGYDGGFIDHYLLPLIYPPGLTRELQIGIGVIVILINAAIYYRVWRGRKNR